MFKMTEQNQQQDKKEEKPTIDGFLTDKEMGLGKFQPVREDNHLKEHFKADVNLSNKGSNNMKDLVIDAFKEIAPEYKDKIEVRKDFDITYSSIAGSYNELYNCYVISIPTGDEVHVGPRTLKYIGNGHVPISHRMNCFLNEAKKNQREVLRLNAINRNSFLRPIMERANESLAEYLEQFQPKKEEIKIAERIKRNIEEIIAETPKEALVCEAKTELFDLSGWGEEFGSCLEGKTIAGMEAQDTEYVKGSDYAGQESKVIEIFKSDPRFRNYIDNMKLNSLEGSNEGHQIINALIQHDYLQAARLNERYLKNNTENPEGYNLVKRIILESNDAYII